MLCRFGWLVCWHFLYFGEVFDWTQLIAGLQYVYSFYPHYAWSLILFTSYSSIFGVKSNDIWMWKTIFPPFSDRRGPGQIDIVIRIGRNGASQHLGILEFGNCKESRRKWISPQSLVLSLYLSLYFGWITSFSLSLSFSFSLSFLCHCIRLVKLWFKYGRIWKMKRNLIEINFLHLNLVSFTVTVFCVIFVLSL